MENLEKVIDVPYIEITKTPTRKNPLYEFFIHPDYPLHFVVEDIKMMENVHRRETEELNEKGREYFSIGICLSIFLINEFFKLF